MERVLFMDSPLIEILHAKYNPQWYIHACFLFSSFFNNEKKSTSISPGGNTNINRLGKAGYKQDFQWGNFD